MNTKNQTDENTINLLALIFGIVATVQTIIPTVSDTDGRVYIQEPRVWPEEINLIVLAIQLFILFLIAQIYRKKIRNNIIIGIVTMLFLNIVPGALLVANLLNDKK